jgi:hypothetical protein
LYNNLEKAYLNKNEFNNKINNLKLKMIAILYIFMKMMIIERILNNY